LTKRDPEEPWVCTDCPWGASEKEERDEWRETVEWLTRRRPLLFVTLVERGRSHNVIVAPTERQWRGGTILHRSYIAYQKATALEMAALALQEAVEGS
jgi:hypothetical protein